jgi:hypothetical protein
MANSGKTVARRPDGMPVGTPFEKGKCANPNGRPKGSISLKTHLRNILETRLPDEVTRLFAHEFQTL